MYLSALHTSGCIHRIYWLTSLYFVRSIKVAGFCKGILPVAPSLTAQVTDACSIYAKQKHPRCKKSEAKSVALIHALD